MQNILRAARYYVSFQLFSKAATFTLNQLLISRIEPSELGIVSIQYELIYSTVLALSREALRIPLSRIDLTSSHHSNNNNSPRNSEKSKFELAQMVNLAWLANLLGPLVLVVLLFGFWLDRMSASLLLYSSSALVELLSEPAFICLQNLHLYHVRALVESISVFIKCVATFVLCIGFNQPPVFAFSVGQFLFTSSLTCSYYFYFAWFGSPAESFGHSGISVGVPSLGQLLPSWQHGLAAKQLQLAVAVYAQTIIKLFLSEGDKIVSTLIANSRDQGLFALVSNYGSLLVRLLFLPLEESVRANAGKSSNSSEFNLLFRRLVKVFTYLLLICIVYPPFYSHFLILILAGRKWIDAAPVLQIYAVYVGLLGVNGISEGYMHSISTQKRVLMNTVFMIVCFILYSLASYLFYHLGMGSVGIVCANILNVSLRIIYSFTVISVDGKVKLSDLVSVPDWKLLFVMFPSTFMILWVVRDFIGSNSVLYFAFGCVAALVNISLIILIDRDLRNIVTTVGHRPDVKPRKYVGKQL